MATFTEQSKLTTPLTYTKKRRPHFHPVKITPSEKFTLRKSDIETTTGRPVAQASDVALTTTILPWIVNVIELEAPNRW